MYVNIEAVYVPLIKRLNIFIKDILGCIDVEKIYVPETGELYYLKPTFYDIFMYKRIHVY